MILVKVYVHTMLERKDYLVLNDVSPLVQAFINRIFKHGWTQPMTTVPSRFSTIVADAKRTIWPLT